MKENKDLYFQMGKRIKEAREKAGMTQNELADHIGRSVQYISQVERGVTGPSLSSLVEFCRALCVSSDFILTGEETPAASPYEKMDSLERIRQLNDSEREHINEGIHILINGLSFRSDKRK